MADVVYISFRKLKVLKKLLKRLEEEFLVDRKVLIRSVMLRSLSHSHTLYDFFVFYRVDHMNVN
jgi:hypothetical protein